WVRVRGGGGGWAAAALEGTATATLMVAGGGGHVSSRPDGIDCDGSCSAVFTESPVTLHAVPDALHDFAGWSGSGCSGTADCDVHLDAAVQPLLPTCPPRPAQPA